MDPSTQNGGQRPSGSTGDVDPNGDVVDRLPDLDLELGRLLKQRADAVIARRRRIKRAVGEFVADDVDREEHLASVHRMLEAKPGARR